MQTPGSLDPEPMLSTSPSCSLGDLEIIILHVTFPVSALSLLFFFPGYFSFVLQDSSPTSPPLGGLPGLPFPNIWELLLSPSLKTQEKGVGSAYLAASDSESQASSRRTLTPELLQVCGGVQMVGGFLPVVREAQSRNEKM